MKLSILFYRRQSTHKNECGVIDLFHEFYSSVLLKQLKLFFLTITDLIQSISSKYYAYTPIVPVHAYAFIFYIAKFLQTLSLFLHIATYGILITAVALYFMKDLLVTIIQSVFKYILNPAIWSRVASDLNSVQSEENSVPVQRVQSIQSISGPDIRDVNISKALDLANKQMELILDQKRSDGTQMPSSGVQVLALEEGKESANDSSLSTTATGTSNEENYDSFEMLEEHEMISLQDIDVMSIDDNRPSTVSTANDQLKEQTPENITITSTDSTSSSNQNSNNRSEISTSDSMQLCNDSNEILSISSDTTSSF